MELGSAVLNPSYEQGAVGNRTYRTEYDTDFPCGNLSHGFSVRMLFDSGLAFMGCQYHVIE